MEILSRMYHSQPVRLVATRWKGTNNRDYVESCSNLSSGFSAREYAIADLPLGKDALPDHPGYEVVGYRPMGDRLYPILEPMEYDWATMDYYHVQCVFYLPDGMVEDEDLQAAGVSIRLQIVFDQGVYYFHVPSSGSYVEGSGVGQNADHLALVFIEHDLHQLGPTRELLNKLIEPLRLFYENALEEAMNGTLELGRFRELYTSALGEFPQMNTYEGDVWLIEFIIGVAMKTAREYIMNEGLHVEDAEEFLTRERALMHVFELEAIACRDTQCGQHDMMRAWEWSWLVYDQLGGVHTISETKKYYDIGFWWHHHFKIPRETILVVGGGLPGVGKSTVSLGVATAMQIPFSDAIGVRALGERSLKDYLDLIRKGTQDEVERRQANALYVQASMNKTQTSQLVMQIAERMKIGHDRSPYGVRYCLHTWFSTNIVSRIVMEYGDLITSRFAEGEDTGGGRVTPEMWRELRRSLLEDAVVDIPFPVRSRIVDWLKIIGVDFIAVGAGGIGHEVMLDKPVGIVQQNLAQDAALKADEANVVNRLKYMAEDNLVFMRLVSIVFAESFGIPIIQGSVQRGGGVVELSPAVLTWTTTRRFFIARLIDRIKQRRSSWPEPLDGQPDVGIWSQLIQIANNMLANLDSYGVDTLWENPGHTDFVDLKKQVLDTMQG